MQIEKHQVEKFCKIGLPLYNKPNWVQINNYIETIENDTAHNKDQKDKLKKIIMNVFLNAKDQRVSRPASDDIPLGRTIMAIVLQ